MAKPKSRRHKSHVKKPAPQDPGPRDEDRDRERTPSLAFPSLVQEIERHSERSDKHRITMVRSRAKAKKRKK